MADDRLQSFDTGSKYDFSGRLDRQSVPRSLFNLSHSLSMSFPANSMGKLVPIFCTDLLPTDKLSVQLDALVRCLPVAKPLYSKQRVTFHLFVADSSSLWQNSEIYYRKGNTGNVVLKKPTLNATCLPNVGNDDLVTSDSLLHYLYGFPIGTKIKDYFGKVTSLPLFMYWKIWVQHYMNRNLYMQNKVNLPDDFSRLRINDDSMLLSALDNGDYSFDLGEWQWRDYPDDRFTGAFPFPQRGDAPTLDYNVTLNDLNVYASDIDKPLSVSGWKASNGDFSTVSYNNGIVSASPIANVTGVGGLNTNANALVSPSPALVRSDLVARSATGENAISLSIYLNDIRRLACAQTELERMARTDGSYAEFGLTFFNKVAYNTRNFDTRFIGGAYKDILYSEVVQTTPTDTSPLGNYSGHGIMSLDQNRGYVGDFESSDYGWCMVLMSVMPDVLYSQGLEKCFTRLSQADEYLPDRARLGMQPILNQELYFSGNPTVDADIFAYDDAFNEYRYKTNRVLGKLSDRNMTDFFQYTQSRYFVTTPTYSQSFATTKDNVRNNYLVAPTECPFTMDVGFNIRGVRPLPYKSKPAQII